MGVVASDVRPGKCFVSVGDRPQVMRVKALREGVVSFEARGEKAKKGEWPIRGEAPVPEFVSGALKEVGMDYKLSSGR